MNKVRSFVKRNSSTILKVSGAVAGAGALYFTAKATIKAVRTVDEMRENGEEVTPKSVIKRVIPYYVPAIGMTAIAVTCMSGTITIESKKKRIVQAALDATHNTFMDYKQTVIEDLGKEKAGEIEKKALNVEPCEESYNIGIDDLVTVIEMFTKQRITTTYSNLKSAQTYINELLNSPGWTLGEVSLGKFLSYLGGFDRTQLVDSFEPWHEYIWSTDYMYMNYETTVVSWHEEICKDAQGRVIILLTPVIPPERRGRVEYELEHKFS